MSNLIDYSNYDPNDGSGDYTQILVAFRETVGTSFDPKIEIDYTTAVTHNATFFGANF